MRVLAFDPGFERLGVAVVEKIGGKEMVVHSECIRTDAKLRSAIAKIEQFGRDIGETPITSAMAFDPMLADWQTPGQVAIQQTGPQPLNLLDVVPELLEGDVIEAGYSPERQQQPQRRVGPPRGPGLHMLVDE